MHCEINGKFFTFNKKLRDNNKVRLSFDELAQKTFGLSFEKWYQAGFWTDKYQPYALLDGERVVANAAVNIIKTSWAGKPKTYIQLGTVMTAPEYRQLGLAKFLINSIFDDWLNKCDAAYLYANDSAVNFYPKFGFVKANEYQVTREVKPQFKPVKKLDMSCPDGIATLHEFYQLGNPFSELPMLDNWGLLMFYCFSFFKDCVYYVETLQAVVIAIKDKEILTVFEVYCQEGVLLTDILSAIAQACSAPSQVKLGFGLKNPETSELSLLHENNSTLLVLEKKENIFQQHKTMLPLLAHA